MRTPVPAMLWASLLVAAMATPGRCEEGLLTFVFGPNSQDAARQSARAAANTARHWLQTAGNQIEIRRAASPEAQRIDSHLGPKELEQAFSDAAMAARDADPAPFLTSLDAATQEAALHPGARIVVAVLNSPPFSSDGEHTLEHLVEVCRTNAVRVVVLDVGESSKTAPNASLSALATKTGGMWLGQAKALEPNIIVVSAAAGEPAAKPAAPAPAGPAAPSEPAPSSGVIPQFEIPVQIRFIRTSGKGSVSSAISYAGGTGITDNAELSDETRQANESIRPMQGLLTVEAPLNALKFDVDDRSGTYQGHARLTATVLNDKGAAIWTGRKEVNIHGAARKLDVRRQGSLFFMRGVTLPGRGNYTLEAKVEDLIGATSGMIRTPLKTSKDVPGLVASDAVAVRPFKGSADRFEADQVFSYDGEALSPALNPVFRAEDDIRLQFYLILYPDLHGAPLDLSMEIQRDGRVVARMPLQFGGALASTAMEGKYGSMQGYGGANGAAILGGQAKEFPYLADLKGAKFSPGNYEAVIFIRQGKQVITRTVAFRVTGHAPVLLASAGGPKDSLVARDDAEDASVVLPEIEPASIDSSGLKMPPEEQKRLWEDAAKNAMGYLSHLPNFRCFQDTHRFSAPVKTPDQLKEIDSFKDELMFEDGKERYRRVETNGVKAENAPPTSQGIHFRNEFGSMLRGLFDPDTAASYKWAGRAMATGVLCEVFEVQVSKVKTNFVLHSGPRREPVAYSGRVFIDEETGLVRKLIVEGTGLPKDFGLQSPSFSLDYGMVRIGADDYLLPLRSVLQLRHLKTFVRNENVFGSYRRFEGQSEIKFQN